MVLANPPSLCLLTPTPTQPPDSPAAANKTPQTTGYGPPGCAAPATQSPPQCPRRRPAIPPVAAAMPPECPPPMAHAASSPPWGSKPPGTDTGRPAPTRRISSAASHRKNTR
ncbi:uncharacterized protein ACHE_70001S [Aspergillus chevalieri]|uniref:Uncharacterized protein n=1 Tax=Aspergillus chevalieri TaxID=182096 RepID=A0A7R7ZKF6_ASPCH|nr:uncharacterized protein ACHE_20002S [Aspergillus chevalieri]XP_043135959.1 uncharacterized protein ACHE_40001S [Aspergillus chevalieri]XP_043139680.1 uncharacterized protein ACHE_70001S [Aspergillus chevalieri]BCR84544.1 hypothetical protein ACHE_20002S [Aspergillus chevalieri]BCR87437.1 hypothetical protein ACHE_40001S [Aspergillus chevalieri]BCR91158.1 hypothetical protein ACHE_70001S [Aspergillus chevalieri]